MFKQLYVGWFTGVALLALSLPSAKSGAGPEKPQSKNDQVKPVL